MRKKLHQSIQKLRSDLKSTLYKLEKNDYELPKKKIASATEFIFSKIDSMRPDRAKRKVTEAEETIDKVPLSDTPIDLETANAQDRGGEGVTYYDTENSEFSRGAPKTTPQGGLDSFGEKDTFDFDEADEFQTNRDRNQNSDLAQRFRT